MPISMESSNGRWGVFLGYWDIPTSRRAITMCKNGTRARQEHQDFIRKFRLEPDER